MTVQQIKSEMQTILERLKFLGSIEPTKEVEVSILELCGEYGGLTRELQEAELNPPTQNPSTTRGE